MNGKLQILYVGSGHGRRYRETDTQSRSPGWVEFFCSHGKLANCTSIIIVDVLTKQKALLLECEITRKYRNEGHPIVNVNDGTHRPTELQNEINKKLRKPKSEIGRKNISLAKQGCKNPMYGKTHTVSKEARERISSKMKGNKNAAGRTISEDTCEKMRQAALRREAKKQKEREMSSNADH